MNINFKRVMLASLAAGAVLSSLSACAPLMVGGAVMGSLVAIDRRTTGIQIEDEGIEDEGFEDEGIEDKGMPCDAAEAASRRS